MKTLLFLIEKEFLQIRRNTFLPKLIIAFPIMIMCVMPWVMNMEVKNIAVSVVDNDRSEASARLVHTIEASRYFIFHGQKASYEAALGEIEQCETDAVVVIPHHYGRDLSLGRTPQVLIAANAVNGTKGSIGSNYLRQIVQHAELAVQHESATLPAIKSAIGTIHSQQLYNPHQDYKVYMIPALMGLLVMLLCGFLPALNIVSEKEIGTIEQINVTPVSKGAFIMAKLIPYWLIAYVVMSVCFILSWAIYGITCQGNLLLVYLLATLLALVFSSMGLIVSNYSDTMQQAMLVMWFFVVCLMLLSGLFTPVRSMPNWAYATTYINPMHYFIDAVRTVFVRGGHLSTIAHQVGALSLFAIVMGSWAVWSYKKNT